MPWRGRVGKLLCPAKPPAFFLLRAVVGVLQVQTTEIEMAFPLADLMKISEKGGVDWPSYFLASSAKTVGGNGI